ncbi:hypothetical protein [Paenibacillus graminis]|uniref:Bacteriophage SP-beta YorD domain-containing protein n=1 Tax=Paenibacillus graminis TaxID=189425 RepID=A0A089NMT0_9BACL|nr:hypothetical protein [Paenibacillus graminis]AIQ70354.1 hypothetical protein PGRAT_24000 [Paenibacillus graminis]MEC0169713.1 hypothetical protein [Paenibacillus graminis]
MQYYVDFASDGNITGFYVDTIHGEDIPESALPIDTEDWHKLSQGAGRYKLDGHEIREKTAEELAGEQASAPPLPPSELEVLRKENALLKAQLSAQSERSDFIEDVISEMASQLYK